MIKIRKAEGCDFENLFLIRIKEIVIINREMNNNIES